MDTDFIARRGYYQILKITDSHDCDYGPCKIYTISNGTDEPVEIGLYLDVPTNNPSGLLEQPLEGAPCLSILETGQ